MTAVKWEEIRGEALAAFEALNIARSRRFEGETVEEWKRVFGPSFSIKS